MENKAKILICDENDDERARLAESLIRSGFSRCDEARDGNAALDMISKNGYDVEAEQALGYAKEIEDKVKQ